MQINLHNVSRHEVHVFFRRAEGAKAEEFAIIPVADKTVITPRDESERLVIVKDLEAAGGIEGSGDIDMNGLCPFLYNYDSDEDQDLIVAAGKTNLETEKMISSSEMSQIAEAEVALPDGQSVALDLELVSDKPQGRKGRR